MIIKIMPENDIEKAKMQEVEHTGVKEFFIFGNKKDTDQDLIDFHEWTGSYRYLVGSLYYFENVLKDEMGVKSSTKPTEINLRTTPQSVPSKKAQDRKLIKKSNIQDGHIDGVVEIQKENGNDEEQAPYLKLVENAEPEMAVDEDNDNDNSKGADD